MEPQAAASHYQYITTNRNYFQATLVSISYKCQPNRLHKLLYMYSDSVRISGLVFKNKCVFDQDYITKTTQAF